MFRLSPNKPPGKKDTEKVALMPQAEDNSFEYEQLVGKYVRTDNIPYDFNAFYNNKNFMLRIHGVPVENVLTEQSDIIKIPINKAWFNGYATFVKLNESSFKNLKTTLENNTGVWEDSIFDGKWFTDEEYARLHKAGAFTTPTSRIADAGGGRVISKPRRNRRSSRRKSNKRRRSRRNINRKTKKN